MKVSESVWEVEAKEGRVPETACLERSFPGGSGGRHF